ncbi:MAG: MgtC/SapB family protein [Bacteroidales bacterium]|jgi:putative Mg2+ transporter-C (MgtC) family protein|nr:MgtC/SapB family protein [Bacteroidales bacterium]MBQ2543780.1 MgtC/SapB family protein [Bacteroidales bacterium]MBQ3942248.1 MgtC/SapB family protein [Bacteroidales bacterium]MBQ4026315.1 MgtC/SapB family protein [Bacteroidales bacterium]
MEIEWNFILRLFIAGILGGLIGFEREFRAKEAGLRTHFIVALGSALFMLISQYAFTGRFDAARVAAQVVSGIGFIGAGVIIFQKNVVRGVTTAAGLWVAAAIGLACGAGMYVVAIAATLFTIMCLETMHIITRRYGEKSVMVTISPVTGEQLTGILDQIRKSNFEIDSFSLTDDSASITLHMRQPNYQKTIGKLLEITKGYKVEIS